MSNSEPDQRHTDSRLKNKEDIMLSNVHHRAIAEYGHKQPLDPATAMFYYYGGSVDDLVVIAMGPNWEDIKRVQLLDRNQRREDRKWDAEFQRRKEELIRQKKESGERKVRNSLKLAEMSARWRSLEQKRIQQGELYLERLRTNLSLTLRQDTKSAGADSFTSER